MKVNDKLIYAAFFILMMATVIYTAGNLKVMLPILLVELILLVITLNEEK